MIKKWSKNILGLVVGLILAFLLLEVFLRVYNPLEYNLEGDKISLPKNKTYQYNTDGILGVDSIVIHKKNAVGFRGENPPKNFRDYKSIVFVGGSTMECTACGEGDDWAAVAGTILKQQNNKYWVNNAGLDGHSTFGHRILVSDYLIQLKPKYIAFLIGVNDMGREDLDKFEQYHIKKPAKTWKHKLVHNSKVLTLYVNLKRSKKAIDLDLGHKRIAFGKYEKVQDTIVPLRLSEEKLIQAFKKRVENLISMCQANGIEPIFITQPTVMGAGTIEGVNFNHLKIREYSGKQFDSILNAYNDITRSLCKQKGLKYIDLWQELPKSPTYFYDEVHFTKAGCKKVGEIVGNELSLYLKED